MQPGGAYLVALIPPGSVEAEMGRVQAALFAEHGLASAQALPALIPVAFTPEPPARGISCRAGALRARRLERARRRARVGRGVAFSQRADRRALGRL